jgi:predicted kinase/8-oxo-dGTP pyrophosphatase MutT (NUDIX family)
MTEPMLVVFAGPPCSGKSTIAALLARAHDHVHLQMDEIRIELFPDSDQCKEHREAAYKEMHIRAERLVREGRTVVLDATYQPFNQREALLRMVERTGVPVYLIECIVLPEEAVRRFRARKAGHAAVDLTSARVEELARKFPFSQLGLPLDTSNTPSESLSEVERYLSESAPLALNAWAQPSGKNEVPKPGDREAQERDGGEKHADRGQRKSEANGELIRLTQYSRRRATATVFWTSLFLLAAVASAMLGAVPCIVFALGKLRLARHGAVVLLGLWHHVPYQLLFALVFICACRSLLHGLRACPLRVFLRQLLNVETLVLVSLGTSMIWFWSSAVDSRVLRVCLSSAIGLGFAYGGIRVYLAPRQGSRFICVSRFSIYSCALLVFIGIAGFFLLGWSVVATPTRQIIDFFLQANSSGVVVGLAVLIVLIASHRFDVRTTKVQGWSLGGEWWSILLVLFSAGLAVQIIDLGHQYRIEMIAARVASQHFSEISEWGVFWLALAGLFAAVEPIRQFIGPIWTRARSILVVGRVSRYAPFDDPRPSDQSLFDLYFGRSSPDARDGFLLPGIPVYFIVKPEKNRRFEVVMKHGGHKPSDSKLVRRAAEYGLDWHGFKTWKISVKSEDYWDWVQEHCIRCTKVDQSDTNSGKVSFDMARVPWVDYVADELSVNLKSSSLPLDMRLIFEGEPWQSGKLKLSDLEFAAQYYSMVTSTASLVTTDDKLIVLQRRSKHVSEGAGGISSSSSGFTHWGKDTAVLGSSLSEKSLVAAALRELYEETSILPLDLHLDLFAPPFIGAALNLLHGRDLNFYAHFHCKLTSAEIALLRPIAKDSWETSQYIFVPVESVKEDGTLKAPHTSLLFNCNRHLRAALLCFAVSGARSAVLRSPQIRSGLAQQS